MKPFKILSQGCLTSTLFLSIMTENQKLMKLFPAFVLLGLIGAPVMAHGNHYSHHKHSHCHIHTKKAIHHCHPHTGNHHARWHGSKKHHHKKGHRRSYYVVPWLHININ